MLLSDFITRNMEAILGNWESFATSCLPAATHMESAALRDHAEQILQAVALDLESPQTAEAQTTKSLGLAPPLFDAPQTAAQTHALLRANSGFNIIQLAAEYRALRASVLRLWMVASPEVGPPQDELIRFNEAIDQALAESITSFHDRTELFRNLLLGMIGHDMRTPLQTIQMTATHLSKLNAGQTVSEAATRLIRGGASIQALLDDLTDFNRTQFGLGIPVEPAPTELAEVFAEEVEQLAAANPLRTIRLTSTGKTSGAWDAVRLRRLLGNLVTNALRYGDQIAPVHVVLTGEETAVRLEVVNGGATASDEELRELFEPLKRGSTQPTLGRHDDGLGLGLFIVREIAKAHGGTVAARTERGTTVFTVVLPRSYTHSEKV